MTVTMNPCNHGGLPGDSLLDLLPLLPVRHLPVAAKHADDPVSAAKCCPNPVADEVAADEGMQPRENLCSRYDQLLNRAACSLIDGQVAEAVGWIQQAHQRKNEWEEITAAVLSPRPEHWLTMSTCSTVSGDDDSAAAFAIQAWQASKQTWQTDLTHDFRDSSADATTLLALNRLRQRRPDRAAILLRCAIDDHRIAGDIEQLMADYLLLFLCEDARDRSVEAADALQFARQILQESLDADRHLRRASLARWLRRYGRPRSMLMKSF